MPNPIAIAIPAFFVLIAVELLVARAKRRAVYRFDDAVTDLSCGISQQVTGLFIKAGLLLGYAWLYENARLVTLPDGPLPWVIAFFGVDFIYYWWHRLSHEVNCLWAAHIVHHQSEDYNLAVALRQSTTTKLTAWPFYAVLALLGVPPLVFALTEALSTLYQFWIHTELVGRLGPFEWAFNTASHHRVHHAVNPRYLDKNYGATLIVWDRLFGTFEKESDAPVYGIVKPLDSFNPLWANVHHWLYMAKTSLEAPRWLDKLRIWVSHPAWRPAGLAPFPPPPEVKPGDRPKYGTDAPGLLKLYVLAQLVLVVLVATTMIYAGSNLSYPALVLGAAFVLPATVAWGGLFERRRWARPLELSRLGLAVFSAWYLGAGVLGDLPAIVLGAAVAAGSAAWLVSMRFKGSSETAVAAPQTAPALVGQQA